MRQFVVAALPLAAASFAFAADVTSTWVGPPAGNWNVAGSWSRGGVPNNGANNYFVIIDGIPRVGSSVSLTDLSPTISTLTIGLNDSLVIGNAITFRVIGGAVANAGLITQNATINQTDFILGANTTFSGPGTLRFSNTQANRIYTESGTLRLTNGPIHTIDGSVVLGASQTRLTNQGMIDANVSAGMFMDLTDGVGINFNTGTLRGSNGGKLTIQGTNLDNSSGLIEAAAGSFVDLNSVTINNGTIRDTDGAGPGIMRNASVITLNGPTLEGPFLCSNATTTHLMNSIQIIDVLSVQGTVNTTDVIIDTSPFTLAGGGEASFSNTQVNRIYTAAGNFTLDVPADFYLHGALQLGVGQTRLTNEGLIEADASAGIVMDLTDGTGINFNTGTMRATNGAKFTIQNTNLDNTNGLIEAAAGSFVDLGGVTISNGTIRDADGAGPGVARNASSITLSGLTLEGPFLCGNATTTHLANSVQIIDVLSVQGTVNTTDVIIDTTPFTLAGGGEALFSNTQVNRLYGAAGTIVLDVPADFYLHGALQLGVGQTRLTNEGLIEADASAGIVMDLTDGAGINFNTGTMRATNGAKFTIQNTNLDNTNGLIEAAAGSFVDLAGATISNGTIRDADGAGPGVMRNASSITLSGTTLEGPFLCANATVTHLLNSIQITDALNIQGAVNTTDVIVESSPFTLSGGGEVVGSNTAVNRLYASNGSFNLINALGNTIRGSLHLGAGQTGITNNGLIRADASSGINIVPSGLGFQNNGVLWLEIGNVIVQGGSFINTGIVLIDSGRVLSRNGTDYIQTAGTTTVNGTFALSSGLFKIQGGKLQGVGSMGAFVNNSGGIVAPGNSAGALTCNGGYSQANAGTFDVEVGGLALYDQLQVVGNATLDGTLRVTRINGFVPDPNDEFTILSTSGTRTGTFSAIDSCDVVTVIYGSNFVKLKITAVAGPGADFNNDGVVNAADLAILLGAWGPCGACCFADINGDGQVDASDLALLLGSWS